MDLMTVDGAIGATCRVLGCSGLAREHVRILYRSDNLVLHFVPERLVAKVTHGGDPAASDRRLELAAAQHMRDMGVPCVTPALSVPARVHHEGSYQITFWDYFEGQSVPNPDRKRARDLLRRLHLALATFRYDALPHFRARLGEATAGLLQSTDGPAPLPEADRLYLLRLIQVLQEKLTGPDTQLGVIHGDCRPGNLLWDKRGIAKWIDFEAICIGPIAWDYAALLQPRDKYLRPHARTISLLADIATICAAARCWRKKSSNIAVQRLATEHLRRLKTKHPRV